MFDRAALKRDVRDILRGNWGKVFLAMLLWVILIAVIQWVAGLLSVFTFGLALLAVSLLLFNPFTVSLCRYMSHFFRHRNAEMGEAFSAFSNFGPTVGAMFWRDLWLFIWGLPAIALMVISLVQLGLSGAFLSAVAGDIDDMYRFFEYLSYSMIGSGTIFMLLSSVASIIPAIKQYSYYMVPYLIGEYPGLEMRQCLDISKKIMQGHKWELFVFQLSFLPWILLTAITCGIAGIYVGPYTSVAEAAYYDHVKNLALDSGVIHSADLTGGEPEVDVNYL